MAPVPLPFERHAIRRRALRGLQEGERSIRNGDNETYQGG